MLGAVVVTGGNVWSAGPVTIYLDSTRSSSIPRRRASEYISATLFQDVHASKHIACGEDRVDSIDRVISMKQLKRSARGLTMNASILWKLRMWDCSMYIGWLKQPFSAI